MCNHMEKNRSVIEWARARFAGIDCPPEVEALGAHLHTWPKYLAPVIVQGEATPALVALRWGVWPFYARGKPQYITNARSDGIISKPVWKQSAAQRRCLVPVSGYYEPGTGPKGAMGEVRFGLHERPAFFIAGVWDTDPDESGTRAFAIVTTEPNDYAKCFHNRMPVVLADADATSWLGDQNLSPDRLLSLCRPCPPEIMAHIEITAVPKGKVKRADLAAAEGELLL
jgi:putative SOS response-associated peptidase YedK